MQRSPPREAIVRPFPRGLRAWGARLDGTVDVKVPQVVQETHL